jgi:transposase
MKLTRERRDKIIRLLAFERGYNPAVPPKKNRKKPWDYDKELYKRRNEVARMFRRLKGFRRIGTRYDKLDIMFFLYNYLALCVIAVCSLILHSVYKVLAIIFIFMYY